MKELSIIVGIWIVLTISAVVILAPKFQQVMSDVQERQERIIRALE